MGRLAGPEMKGITAGRGSYLSVFKQMVTKKSSGQISRISGSTAWKMASSKQAEGLTGTAFGPIRSAVENQFMPGGAECGCEE
jgi:hypothetical protein